MKNSLRWTVVLAAFLLACSSFSSTYDFDPDIDFQQYKTYRWMRTTSERLGVQKNSLADKRIRHHATFHINQTGLKEAEGQTDLLVVYYVATQNQYNVTAVSYGYGPHWGTSAVAVSTYKQGTIILDMVDRDKQELVWRGVASDNVNHNASKEELDAKLDNLFYQMLLNYPPPVSEPR